MNRVRIGVLLVVTMIGAVAVWMILGQFTHVADVLVADTSGSTIGEPSPTTGMLVLPTVGGTSTAPVFPTKQTVAEEQQTSYARVETALPDDPRMATGIAARNSMMATMTAQEFATPFPGCERREIAVALLPNRPDLSNVFWGTITLTQVSYVFNMTGERASLLLGTSDRDPDTSAYLSSVDKAVWRAKIKPFDVGVYQVRVLPLNRVDAQTYHTVLLICP